MTQTFTGVLAVLHRRTVDGRQLDDPGPELTRELPLVLRRVSDSDSVVGAITRVWLDGHLVRYSGHLFPEASETSAAIRAGELVGMLDADRVERMEYWYRGRPVGEIDGIPLDADDKDVTVIMHGWRVSAATLLPPEGKAWPEICLTLDAEPGAGR